MVQMMYAVDFGDAPLHSYRANMKHLDGTRLYLGSNNYLQDAIEGRYSEGKGILCLVFRCILFITALINGKE